MGEPDTATHLAVVFEHAAELLRGLTPEQFEALADGRLALAVVDDQDEP